MTAASTGNGPAAPLRRSGALLNLMPGGVMALRSAQAAVPPPLRPRLLLPEPDPFCTSRFTATTAVGSSGTIRFSTAIPLPSDTVSTTAASDGRS